MLCIVIAPARRIAFDLLTQIESGRAFSDDALNSEVMNSVDVRDRRLITEIVYGSLRRQSLLDYMLAKSSTRPWPEVASPSRVLLRMSLYQMAYMDRIPDHALVHDAVELAKKHLKHGIDRYCNGMLRSLARTRPWEDSRMLQDSPAWIRMSIPRWLWKRWVRRYGKEAAEAYARSLMLPPETALRLGTGQENGALPFRVLPSDLVPGAYIPVREETGSKMDFPIPLPYQDEASQLIPHLLGDVRGRSLWDACAAPGGKTAILCEKAGDTGVVVASDRSFERLKRLRTTGTSGGSCRAAMIVADAGRPAPFRMRFDAVVVDVPCSGLGTLRRNPEIKWRFRPGDFPLLQENQLNILDSVSQNVRPGGRLLYSTCSTEPEENEQVVERFLAGNPDFRLEMPDSPQGILEWVADDRMIRTFPGTRLWDGFFAALMVRCG
jgi:16S rRNA (cytosine967-C5)-methyltransferase